MRSGAALLVIVFSAGMASGATYVVNPQGTGDFPTIQNAIDAVTGGDTIELTDGVFTGEGNWDLDFGGFSPGAITLRSQSDNPDACIIDCAGPHFGILLHANEGPATIVRGLTIANSSHDWSAMSLYSASPTVLRCTFENNVGGSFRRAVYCFSSSACFTWCTFSDNSGGVSCQDDAVEISHCTFTRNGWAVGAHGTHLDVSWCTFTEHTGTAIAGVDVVLTLTNSTLSENAGHHAGGVSLDRAHATIANTIIAFGSEGSAIYLEDTDAELSCCNLYGNAGGDWIDGLEYQLGIDGNISMNPRFCGDADPEHPLALYNHSPCAPFTPPNPTCDLIGAWPVLCYPQDTGEPADAALGLHLVAARPNPFARVTHIALRIPTGSPAGRGRLAIYDTAGRLVRTLGDGPDLTASQRVVWDGTNQSGEPVRSGVYFCHLTDGNRSVTRPLILVR